MKKAAIYSSTRRAAGPRPGAAPAASAPGAAPAPVSAAGLASGIRAFLRRHASLAVFAAGGLFGMTLVITYGAMREAPYEYTQEDIDAAVLHTLENNALPSRAARAAERVQQAVVRVRGFTKDEDGNEVERDVGSGVVIIDDGLILTNLHVVAGAERVAVTFHDGLESEAALVGLKPETDLAVIRAKQIPDDLAAATLGSTAKLQPGDEVVAVGFPFGIGPSVSAGVISGLNREFRSDKGERVLTRLIQFDAAANPGNSGGPLVTMEGDVIGIVTAILNPTEARTFIGIGFAVTIEAAGSAVGIPPF
jgi:S1-C subfamily serine protease